ncbi:MAG: hypothetical protein EP344_04465 [Bacteroidetes bacterium]|nr:MAG: hypothetical protein EP344_04465 [Bacteroidota bacterium]
MKYTNRSLWFAVLACLAMGLFARAPQFRPGAWWITATLLFSTLALSATGFWLGLRGARRQKTLWAWLAVGINAFIFISFLAFVLLLVRAIRTFSDTGADYSLQIFVG